MYIFLPEMVGIQSEEYNGYRISIPGFNPVGITALKLYAIKKHKNLASHCAMWTLYMYFTVECCYYGQPEVL